MNLTEKLFINIIANYINDVPVDERLIEQMDVERMKELVRIHKVAAISYTILKQYPVDKQFLDYIERGFLVEVMFHQKKINTLSLIKNIFSENNIECLCVKGCHICKLYPNPEFRTMGDLDILVKEEDMIHIKELFVQKGMDFVPENSYDNVWNFRYRGTEIEIHSNLISEGRMMNDYDYKSFFKDAFEHKVRLDEQTYKLEDEYNLTYTLFHIAKHFYNSGCGVRMLMDIPVMVNKFDLDWDRLWHTLKEIKLEEFSIRLFRICEKWFGQFGVRYPKDYNLNECEDFTPVEDFILAGGIYGFHNRNTDADVIKMKINEKGGKGSYIKGALIWAFPGCKRMREYSPWFRNKPAVLLPIAYIERFIRNAKERGGIIKWGRNVFTGKRDLKEKEKILDIMRIK
ncbi:MAG: nucleotidyltransferase family protein [Lachnospiraceae bacterium]|nr:nucleotidyltransferase family protein [Lachnospiraceae bacterium]